MKLSLTLASLVFFSTTAATGCALHTPSGESRDEDAVTSANDITPLATTLTFGYSPERRSPTDPVASGPLTAGTTLSVQYDAYRLVEQYARCSYEPNSPDGMPRTSIDLGLEINGDPARVYTFAQVALFGAENLPPNAAPNNRIALPEDTRTIALWFSCHAKVSGYVAYDSQNGANYTFAVAPKPTPAGRWDAAPKTLTTGTKNALDAARWYDGPVASTHDDSYYYPGHVEVAYDDLNGFAAGQDTLTASVGLREHIQGRERRIDLAPEWHQVTLTRAGDRFVGQVDVQLWGSAGTDERRIDGVDVAVTNGSAWDSDLGRNYRLDF